MTGHLRDLRIAWAIARRELRDSLGRGLGGFRILIACLALGVAAIAAVGATRAAVEDGIARDAKRIAGGDLEARLLYREATPEQQAAFQALGRVARIAEMRTMARVGERRQLAALKAVDAGYPLYGGLTLAPALTPEAAFGVRDGAYGAAVDQAFLDATGLSLGAAFVLNRTRFVARAVVTEEADRSIGLLSLGPRVLIDHAALAATGLTAPGALVTWRYRIALPPEQSALAALQVERHALELLEVRGVVGEGDLRHQLRARRVAQRQRRRTDCKRAAGVDRSNGDGKVCRTISLRRGGSCGGGGIESSCGQRLPDALLEVGRQRRAHQPRYHAPTHAVLHRR